jgi:hypothetical protein
MRERPRAARAGKRRLGGADRPLDGADEVLAGDRLHEGRLGPELERLPEIAGAAADAGDGDHLRRRTLAGQRGDGRS